MGESGLDYLNEHQNDHEWAEIVLVKYNEIIEDYDERDRPEVCALLSATLGHWAYSFDSKDETRKIIDASLKIGRIGLNLLRLIEPKAPIEYRLTAVKTVADLCMTVAISLECVNRYMACLEYLDRAEQHYKQYLDVMPSVSEQDRINCESMYEFCRGKEAEAWYRMVNDIPEKERANYLLFSKSYLMYSMRYLSQMGCE